MKIFTVGSKSFVTSFQLAGIPGIVSPTPEVALDEIKKLTDDSDVGLVLVSDDITESIGDDLSEPYAVEFHHQIAHSFSFCKFHADSGIVDNLVLFKDV